MLFIFSVIKSSCNFAHVFVGVVNVKMVIALMNLFDFSSFTDVQFFEPDVLALQILYPEVKNKFVIAVYIVMSRKICLVHYGKTFVVKEKLGKFITAVAGGYRH